MKCIFKIFITSLCIIPIILIQTILIFPALILILSGCKIDLMEKFQGTLNYWKNW